MATSMFSPNAIGVDAIIALPASAPTPMALGLNVSLEAVRSRIGSNLRGLRLLLFTPFFEQKQTKVAKDEVDPICVSKGFRL